MLIKQRQPPFPHTFLRYTDILGRWRDGVRTLWAVQVFHLFWFCTCVWRWLFLSCETRLRWSWDSSVVAVLPLGHLALIAGVGTVWFPVLSILCSKSSGPDELRINKSPCLGEKDSSLFGILNDPLWCHLRMMKVGGDMASDPGQLPKSVCKSAT